MPFQDGLIHVARIREVHDDVPPRFLGKHLIRLRHVHLLGQHHRVVPVGHTQQHTVVIGFQRPHLQIARRRHERSVVVVNGVAQHVVVAINLPTCLQQLHLVGKPTFGKHADGLFVGGFIPSEGHIHVHNLLHPRCNTLHIALLELFARPLLEVAVVAARDGVLHKQLRTREQVLRSLVEQEAERAHISAMARAFTRIHKLDVAILEQTKLQPLRGVVHFSRHHGVRQLDVVGKLLIDIQQRSTLGKTLGSVVVFAAYL